LAFEPLEPESDEEKNALYIKSDVFRILKVKGHGGRRTLASLADDVFQTALEGRLDGFKESQKRSLNPHMCVYGRIYLRIY